MSESSAATLDLVSTVCFTACAIALGPIFVSLPVAPRPVLGPRGAVRRRALDTRFALVEPAMRLCAGSISRLPLGGLRERLEVLALRSGRHLGLDADDCLGLCLVSAIAFGTGAALVVHHGALAPGWIVALTCSGAALPIVALVERARARTRQIARTLPSAIDLAALCMGAGLDFAGALTLLARESRRPDDHLTTEIDLVLAALATGQTRREALEGFAERAPAPAVRDFVSAVIQAEEKGTPLAEALSVQAELLRMRRSAAGEEAAARASVLLAFPLLLLLGAILVLMLGPFLVGGAELG